MDQQAEYAWGDQLNIMDIHIDFAAIVAKNDLPNCD